LRKRIAYLVQGLGTGGLERVVLHLACEMVRRGHEVMICCYDRRGNLADEAEQGGAHVEVVPRKAGVDLGYVWRLARWFRRHRPDVLHMHNETALFYGTLAGKLARVPCLIYTEHDGVFPRSLAARWANRTLVRWLTQAVAVSQAVRDLWCRHDGIDPAWVTVIPNGVPDIGEPVGGQSRCENGRFRIGCVSRLNREKGVDILIEAFARVHKQAPEAELVLVGDGVERTALGKQAAGLGVAEHVQFLGTRDDVPALLATFDVFVLPSRTEGLPMALLEAMAAGLPIVATAVGGVPQAIRHRETGLLVPAEKPEALAESLMSLFGNTTLRQSLGHAARRRFLEEYEVSHMTEAYERLLFGDQELGSVAAAQTGEGPES